MRRTVLSAALTVVAAIGVPASAQVLLDPAIKSSTQALTAPQRQKIVELVDGQAGRFAEADAAGITVLRNQIVTFLKDPTTKDPCRREYAAEFVRAFRKFAAESGDMRLLRATNAFIIARHAPTADTVGLLLDNADTTSQPDVAVRVAAASQLPLAVRTGQFAGPQADATAKRLAALLKTETDWVVAAHEGEAIIEALRTKSLPPAQAESIAVVLGGAVNDVTKRMLDGNQPQLVNALQRMLLGIRNQTADVAATARAKLFAGIGPSIDRLAAMKGKPSATMADPRFSVAFESVTNTSDLLKQVRASTK
jgi:hypothetical protein